MAVVSGSISTGMRSVSAIGTRLSASYVPRLAAMLSTLRRLRVTASQMKAPARSSTAICSGAHCASSLPAMCSRFCMVSATRMRTVSSTPPGAACSSATTRTLVPFTVAS